MILYLNGTSSSGKTSIALEFQKQLDKPIIYFSIDTLLYALNPQVIESIKGKNSEDYKINWNSLFSGYFECVRDLVSAGNFVIADCPIYSEGLYNLFEKSLKQVENKLVVGIECSLETTQQREINRKDRALGIAEKQYHGIHQFIKYDLKVNSELISPDKIAKMIIENM